MRASQGQSGGNVFLQLSLSRLRSLTVWSTFLPTPVPLPGRLRILMNLTGCSGLGRDHTAAPWTGRGVSTTWPGLGPQHCLMAAAEDLIAEQGQNLPPRVGSRVNKPGGPLRLRTTVETRSEPQLCRKPAFRCILNASHCCHLVSKMPNHSFLRPGKWLGAELGAVVWGSQ